MLYNTGTLQADGKISSSPVEHQAQDYNFSKTGEVTDADNNIITWTITLNDGSFDLGSETITVTDPLPKGLEYVENTLQLYRMVIRIGILILQTELLKVEIHLL